MPVMDGIDAAITIRQWQKEGKPIKNAKLVLVTGDEKVMGERDFDKKLFDDILLKPLNTGEIQRVLNNSILAK